MIFVTELSFKWLNMEDRYITIGGTNYDTPDSLSITDTTPLLGKKSHVNMPDKNIGISQQTLVSNNSENAISSRKLPQYVAALASTLGALAAGMVIGWTSPAKKELFRKYQMSENEFSWIGSIFNLGAATICVPIGILTEIIGRKKSMLVLVVPFTIGWALIIWANSVIMFDIGRYILGVSGGAFCVTAPMYTAEIAESSIRGSLGSYFQLMLTVGILITYVIGSLVSVFTLSLISAIVPLIFFVIFFFMPETPTYLLKKGQMNAARDSYRWLRGQNYDIEPELEAQNTALNEANRSNVSLTATFRSKAARKGLLIGFGLMFFQQLSGVNAIIFYSSDIFSKSSDGSDTNSDRATIIVGAMQVVAVLVSTFIVDRLGRRILLLVSSIAMCITTFVLGIYFHLLDNGHNVSAIGWLPLVSICTFIILFSIGFGPIPWMMMGEIFSPQIKGIAGSTACLFNWIMAFIVTKFYNDLKEGYGTDTTFWIFSVICGIGVVFVFTIVPETKGKSLEQIQIELSDDAPLQLPIQHNKV